MAKATKRKRGRRLGKRGSRVTFVRPGSDPAAEVLRLKLEHIIVLQSLENANRSHQRAVGVSEIIQMLTTRNIHRLERSYQQSLSSIITKILTLLIARGLVFSPGIFHRRRSYASVYVLDSSRTNAPNFESRRFRVLGLVRSAVEQCNRAVRSADILSHAESYQPVEGITKKDISHAVLSLAETGELSVIGHVRGQGKGQNLYLPSDMDVALYRPTQPLTWLDEVAQLVENLWLERVQDAKLKGSRPRPFTTGDVRARIVKSSFLTKRELSHPQIIVDAVSNLATTQNPLLRKVKRPGQKSLLWIPTNVRDEEIDFENSYANDAERIGVAVERAVKRRGRPVTVRDVQDEIDRDLSLQPISSSSLFQDLAYAARESFYDGKRKRTHSIRRVFRVGRAGGVVYYDKADCAMSRSFVAFRQISLNWEETDALQQLEGVKNASIPSVAVGRAMLISQEMNSLLEDLSRLLSEAELDRATRNDAKELSEKIREIMVESQAWLATTVVNSLPSKVMNTPALWTATEFLNIIKPLYPLAETWQSPHKLIRMMYRRVRHIHNPDYQNRFSKNSRSAAEFYFDLTDALIYTAKRWGGPECSLQATLAQRELGYLRDSAFVFPALESRKFEIKLATVACLAFLRSETGHKRLKLLIEDDPDAGIRQSALWAYCFAGGKEGPATLKDKASNDVNPRVREFAKQLLDADGAWFKI